MKQVNIQAAIFAKLNTALTVPVFDNVPQKTAYPYVVIGDDTSVPFDTDDSLGTEATITIHVWSQYRGRKQVKEIMQQIYDALHRGNVAVSDALLIESQAEFEQTIVESDGLTRHGIIRFRLTIDQTGT